MKNKATISLFCGFAFLSILILLHFLKTEYNPLWRMISEYEIGKYGMLMRCAFFCWAGGVLFLVLSIWKILPSIAGRIGKWWLLIISLALFGAGIWQPQPITDTVRGTTDALHSACGVIMIFTFPIATALLAKSLVKTPIFEHKKKLVMGLTLLNWVGFIAFFAAIIIFAPANRAYNETTLIGLPNRFMAVCYTLWILGIAHYIRKYASI